MTSAKEVESFNSDNFIPDAARMLENRKGGITIVEGCLELIDNAEDAGSTETSIYLDYDDKYNNLVGVWILDNGKGMNSEELFNAVKLPGKDIIRAIINSIGKFHTGLKNATIGMGNDIYVVTKYNNEYRAIYMNIKNMQSLNTFRPTAYWNDEKTITNNIYNKHIWDIFTKYESGTLIYVKNIHPHISTSIEKVFLTLKTNIIRNYTKLKATLYINTISGDKIKDIKELKIEDEFYNNSPEKIEVFYETKLLYYDDKTLIEELESTRARGQNMINATKENPIHYMFKQCEGKNARMPYNKNHIELEKNSKKLKKYSSQQPLGTMLIKVISVTSEAYSAETKSQDEDGEGESTHRKGVYFIRDNRVVSHANLLGMNLDDHYNRIRMSVTYPPELDLELGCTTQKQINNVNSPEIRDALVMIFRQCAANIIKQQKDTNFAKKNSKEQQKSSNNNEVSNNEGEVSNKEGEVSNKEGEVSNNEGEVSNKEGEVSNTEGEVSNKEGEVSNKEGEVSSNKEGEVSNKEGEVSSNKEGEVSNKEGEASNKEGEVSNKEDEVSNKEGEVSSNKEDEVSNKEDEVSNKEGEVSNKEDEVSNKDDEASKKEDEVSIKDDETSNKDDEVSNKDDEVSNKEHEKDIRQKKVSAYVSGTISGVQLKELFEIINKEIDCNKNYVDDYVKFYNLGKRLFSPNL